MVGGSGVRLAAESVVRDEPFFLALDARQDQRNLNREAIVTIASAIDVAWLEEMFPQEIRRERNAVYDEERDRVVAHGTVCYRDLVLREDKDAAVDRETASRVLIDWASTRFKEIVAGDEAIGRWMARVALVSKAMPDQGWPSLGEVMRDAVTMAGEGKRSLAELRAALLPVLQGFLQYPLDRLLETEAPETIEMPSGSRIRLTYADQNNLPGDVQPPVLAVRLQELFGWTATPRIAGGRVPVRLHLLGPNFRPVQITDDLASFWANTYFQVRKDLRVRYPKHSWPEDPLSAKPEAKGSRRPR
jgi:ATP-dependent helicase HrpB